MPFMTGGCCTLACSLTRNVSALPSMRPIRSRQASMAPQGFDTPMRVVKYRLQGMADAEPLYRLATTILDEAQFHQTSELAQPRYDGQGRTVDDVGDGRRYGMGVVPLGDILDAARHGQCPRSSERDHPVGQ